MVLENRDKEASKEAKQKRDNNKRDVKNYVFQTLLAIIAYLLGLFTVEIRDALTSLVSGLFK
jgi:hypothetical protein